jgi:DNA topoisomerase IB
LGRLRRADCGAPGLARRRRGRGFELLDEHGRHVDDAEIVARVNELAIPPAWRDVWICPDPRGHIQATGIDDAGRRQYLYHPDWHAQRARRKFAEMEEFARALPALRAHVEAEIDGDGMSRERVLACMVRLLDRGFFRIGCEGYAEANGTYGLATMRKDHVEIDGDTLEFDYPAKAGIRRVQHVVDPASAEVVRALRRRRGGGDELFAFKEPPSRRWCDVRSEHVNAYLKDVTGLDISAKDFRTWNATVLAAVAIAVSGEAWSTKTARRRAVSRAVAEVARYLGNTPAVCRASYIDPRVFDRYRAGATIAPVLAALPAADDSDPDSPPATHGAIEEAVLDLLQGDAAFAGAVRG